VVEEFRKLQLADERFHRISQGHSAGLPHDLRETASGPKDGVRVDLLRRNVQAQC